MYKWGSKWIRLLDRHWVYKDSKADNEWTLCEEMCDNKFKVDIFYGAE